MKQPKPNQKAIEAAVSAAVAKVLSRPKMNDPRRGLANYPQRMTMAQVAAYLNCTSMHIITLVDSGQLRSVDIATPGASRRCLRIFRESVGKYEARQESLLNS